MDIETEQYWSKRYRKQSTGWDIGYPSTPLKEYFDQLENKDISILIPGAGNAYEAEYLHNTGFRNVFVMDISDIPLNNFAKRVPDFPKSHLIKDDFFMHSGEYELIIEQTFFCSFPPLASTRENYAKKMNALLMPGGKLVGLWFDSPLTDDQNKRPFGGSKEEYLRYLKPHFSIQTFEISRNSIQPRIGMELFGIFKKPI
ncbi:MAG: hypothetical protein ACI8XB_000198 [Patiriisocius sp.]|jgi:hypothetical protein